MTSVEIPYSIACALPSLTVIDITNDVSHELARNGHTDGIAYISPADETGIVRVNERETGFFEDAGFVKLRELSLTYFAPGAWASRLGASALTFTLTGRNLATWTKYTGVDPELNDAGQSNFNTADFLTQPPVRYFLARINVTF